MKRKYESSHPWISFQIDLTARSQRLWILLGEAKSKCEHIANVILEPETSRRLHQVFLAKGVMATTAIEGNTLSEEEILKQLEGKLELPPSKQYLAQETQNIIDACNAILRDIREGSSPELNVATIKEFNRRVLDKLQIEEDVVAGEIRKHSVAVGRYRAAPAEDCEFLSERLCEWLNGAVFRPPEDMPQMSLVYAMIKAVLAHLYVAWIHPFGDGNGRTARLIELLILVTSGVPAPAAHLLSNHYNLTRAEYYRQLDRGSRSGGDVLPFLTYALQGFVDGLMGQIEHIHLQQWKFAWEKYVFDQVQDDSSAINERRCHLVLALSEQQKPVPLSKLLELSPRVAAAYGAKTKKTLMRDLGRLRKKGLVELTETGYRAKREVVLAFRPLVVNPNLQSQ